MKLWRYIGPQLASRASAHLLFIAALLQHAHGDLLTNRNFESGTLSGWTAVETGWSIGPGISGGSETNGAIFLLDSSNWGAEPLLYQDVPVTQALQYSAHVFVQSTNISLAECWLGINWRRSDGSSIYTVRSAIIASNQSYAPAQQILAWTAPHGAVTARVMAYVSTILSMPDDSDTFAFDQFSFEQNPPSLLTNEDFETATLDGWSTIGTQWSASVHPLYGTHEARYTHKPEETNSQAVIYQCFPVSPGLPYTAYVRIYSEGPIDSEAWLEVQWSDTNGAIVASNKSAHASPQYEYILSRLYSLTSPTNAVTACLRGVIDVSQLHPENSTFFSFDTFTIVPRVPLSMSTPSSDSVLIEWDGKGPRSILQQSTNLIHDIWYNTQFIPDLVSNRWSISLNHALSNAAYRYQLLLP